MGVNTNRKNRVAAFKLRTTKRSKHVQLHFETRQGFPYNSKVLSCEAVIEEYKSNIMYDHESV